MKRSNKAKLIKDLKKVFPNLGGEIDGDNVVTLKDFYPGYDEELAVMFNRCIVARYPEGKVSVRDVMVASATIFMAHVMELPMKSIRMEYVNEFVDLIGFHIAAVESERGYENKH